MPVIIQDSFGDVLARSKNLRGVLTYARRHPVKRASVYRKGEGANVAFHFQGDASCTVAFASFDVAWQWIESRRSWRLHLTGHSATLRDYVA